MRDFSTQTSFSRTLYNDAKFGAYYTDPEHCRRIGRMIRFKGEATVLEPSVGDGTALMSVLAAAEKNEGSRLYTYGVEIQKKAAEQAVKVLDHVLWTDFLLGTKIQKNAFGFCFTNPPYGETEGKQRLEENFINATYPLLAPGALLCAVLPIQTFLVSGFLRSFYDRFSFGRKDIFRFDDKEYSKYHQLAVFARRRVREGYDAEDYKQIKEMFENEADSFPYLPKMEEEVPQIYEVDETQDEKIETFAMVQFDAAQAAPFLKGSPLYKRIEDLKVNRLYRGMKIGNPPAPLKRDLLYLSAISGAGQGKAGNAKEKTLHLQRGTVKPVTTKTFIYDSNNDVIGEEERTSSQITMNIVEPCGRVSSLVGSDKEETA